MQRELANMRWLAAAAVAFSSVACAQILGIPDTGPIDGAPWAPMHVDIEDVPDPAGSLTVPLDSFYIYDTDARGFDDSSLTNPEGAVVMQSDESEALILSVDELDVQDRAVLIFQGSRPVIIVARGAVTIGGFVAVASLFAPGAGADPIICPVVTAGVNDTGGGGGGGGGGFQGNGGNGGPGDSDDDNGNGQSQGGMGGMAVGIPEIVRGGCFGGSGGSGLLGGGGSVGGSGGGAVEIVSLAEIVISGVVDAAGSGGDGGLQGGEGGGGGGSGGYIGLDAPAITLEQSASLAANGGGGGEGGGSNNPGNPGENGRFDNMIAEGGGGRASFGGDGGRGSGGPFFNGQDGTDMGTHGGPGGGGGAGYILVHTRELTDMNASVSPERIDIPPPQ